MNKTFPFFRLLPFALATMILSGCAFTDSESPSKLAKLIPEDAWLIATIRPGQIQEKMDYDSFVHMPAIAYHYSTGSLFDSIGLEDQRELDMALYITHMIEDPSESSSIPDSVPHFAH